MFEVLNFEYLGIQIEIPILYPMTLINGESGTGKSFIFQALQDQIRLGTELGKRLWLIDYNNFALWERAFKEASDIIVIDGIDLLCAQYPDALDVIKNGNRSLIAFGRNITGYPITSINVGILLYKNNKLAFSNDTHPFVDTEGKTSIFEEVHTMCDMREAYEFSGKKTEVMQTVRTAADFIQEDEMYHYLSQKFPCYEEELLKECIDEYYLYER